MCIVYNYISHKKFKSLSAKYRSLDNTLHGFQPLFWSLLQ